MKTISSQIAPVILSGGQGKRLWPLSRADRPKQFVSLFSRSLFEETLWRCNNDSLFAPPLILCARRHHAHVKRLLLKAEQRRARIILEPVGRNTAAAVIAAALAASRTEDMLLILPSDHYIPNRAAFCQAIEAAAPLASDGRIVMFGILPRLPCTGFGYIERGEETQGGYTIKNFHEKPERQQAQEYFRSWAYYWHSGIILARADIFLAEADRHAPDILAAVKRAWKGRSQLMGDDLLDEAAFAAVRPESVDRALLEKTGGAVVAPAAFEWHDLGTWENILRFFKNRMFKTDSIKVAA